MDSSFNSSNLVTYPADTLSTTTFGHDHNSTNFCEPIRITPLIITTGIVGTGILVGNILVVVSIVGGNAKFFRPMYWIIIHLSCSDMAVGLMLMWNYCLAAVFDIHNTVKSLAVLQGIWVTSACASVYGILMLAIDRYMQVVHRKLHSRYVNQFNVGLAIFLGWAFPIIAFLVIPLTSNWSCMDRCSCHAGRYIECEPYENCSQVIPPFTKSCLLTALIYLFFIMPWPILIYLLIFVKARKSQQLLHHKMRKRDFKLIRTLMVIMLAFILTISPVGVVLSIDYFLVRTKVNYDTKLVDYALYTVVLFALNCLLNPILYIWRIPAIQLSLLKKLRSCCGSKTSHIDLRLSRAATIIHERIHSNAPSPGSFTMNPTNRNSGRFKFFDGRFAFQYSDDSQDSTPISQRSSRTRRRPAQLEMQALSDDHHHPTSPLCIDSTADESSGRLMTYSARSSNTRTTALLHSPLSQTRHRGLAAASQ